MIRLNQSDAGQKIVVTLTELTTLTNPFYLFVFTHDMTKEVSKIVLNDNSNFKDRYNIFQIDGSFFEKSEWYSYKVYQQDSFNNTDIDQTSGLVEEGRLFVVALNPEVFIQKDTDVSFTEYNN